MDDDFPIDLDEGWNSEPHKNTDDILGLDDNAAEDVKIRKVRVAHKLNAELLESPRGLPHIRQAMKKFRFKTKKEVAKKYGYSVESRSVPFTKTHYYENLSRVLRVYQLWGHSIFPKAKFYDFSRLIDKPMREKRIRELRGKYILEDMDRMHPQGIEIDSRGFDDIDAENLSDTDMAPRNTDKGVVDNMQEEPDVEIGNNSLFVGDDDLYTTSAAQQEVTTNDRQNLSDEEFETIPQQAQEPEQTDKTVPTQAQEFEDVEAAPQGEPIGEPQWDYDEEEELMREMGM